mmetsp:Transcript_36889/g.61267  ORF Transcript_36889/g.61267 Transcript_36889/m.61267 type:complete len:110 (+) Transcript_36889:161-490(+)
MMRAIMMDTVCVFEREKMKEKMKAFQRGGGGEIRGFSSEREWDGLDADDDRLEGLVALGKELGELLLEFLWETSTIRDVVEERHDLSVELADGSVGPLAAIADDLLPSL